MFPSQVVGLCLAAPPPPSLVQFYTLHAEHLVVDGAVCNINTLRPLSAWISINAQAVVKPSLSNIPHVFLVK